MNNLILLQETRQSIPYSKIDNDLRRSTSINVLLADHYHWFSACDVTYYTDSYHNEDNMLVLLLPIGQVLFIPQDYSHVKQDQILTINLSNFLEEEEEEEEVDTTWFQITYVEEMEQIVAISHSGKIVTISTSTDKDDRTATVKLVGHMEQGIITASWSPDRELLVLITPSALHLTDNLDNVQQTRVIIAMNSSLDILEQVTLPSTTNSTDPCSITWKPPHGQLFAISSVDSDDGLRKIRIYQRDTLSYHATGLVEDGSGRSVLNIASCPICWAGSGCSSLLTAIQATSTNSETTTNKVIFFESNGLRHKEFTIPTTTDTSHPLACSTKVTSTTVVEQLEWNASSDLLAVSSSVTTTSRNLEDAHDLNYLHRTAATTKSNKVQIFHRRNYHWYLKYELAYDDTKRVSHIQFDLFQPYRLLVTLYNSSSSSDEGQDHNHYEKHFIEWRFYDFCWDTNISVNNNYSSTAAVIDGTSLLLTPFHRAIVPPPMYSYKVQLPNPILQVIFHPHQNSSYILTHLANGNLGILGHNSPSTIHKAPQVLATLTIQNDCCDELTKTTNVNDSCTEQEHTIHDRYDATRLRHFLILGEDNNNNILYLLSVECTTNAEECIVLLQVDTSKLHTSSKVSAHITKRIPLIAQEHDPYTPRVLRLVSWMTSTLSSSSTLQQSEEKVLVHLTDGSLLEFNIQFSSDNNDCIVTRSHSSYEPLMEPCPWISAIPLSNISDVTTRPMLIVGLSRRHRLYCGEQLLSDAASSFIVSHGFVIFVSLGSKPQLNFLPIPTLAAWDPLSGADDEEQNRRGYEPRQLERGSQIVAVVSSEPPKIVLQLPRGNLEVVVPRALTLPFCFQLIHDKKYGLALDVMRQTKIDMNLLVDFHPLNFLDNISTFLVDSLQRHNEENNIVVDRLNLFLSVLTNEDVTQYKYPIPEWFLAHLLESPQSHDSQKRQFDFSCKVNTVCQQIRLKMLDFEESNISHLPRGYFLLPILSSFAKEAPPQLESALEMIRNNASRSEATARNLGSQKSPFLSEKAQSSIQYLAFLADYELLFNTALGMYDFDLAKAVARNSQMDPKVFLPMLKRFSSLPDKAIARYEVDMKLGRFESALRNLSKVQINSTEEEEKHFDLCLDIVEEHQLHKLALSLFQENKRMHHDIMVSLGERLLREQKYQAALSAFLAADPKDLAGAKRAARLCRDWRTFFSCCFEQRLQPNAKESANGASDGAALIKRSVAAEVANELSQQTLSMHGAERRDALLGAARILLDYCQDVNSAVDMLISGQLWNEAKRISLLYARSDLDHLCSDAAEVYAETCMQDFDERAEAFEEANKRYLVVLHIVQEQKRSALATGDIVDDKGSVYSAASNLSATSLYSNMSSSSVGTVTSLSSVISASATSTFSLSTHTDANKHKSKYNIIGKDQAGRKKKKERKQKMKMKRGSEDELKSLVSTMEQNCVFDYYLISIAETMFFLSKIGKLNMAKKMFDCYEDMRTRIEISQANRKSNRNTVTSMSRDNDEEVICVGCEKIADSLLCSQLPQELRDFFSYV